MSKASPMQSPNSNLAYYNPQQNQSMADSSGMNNVDPGGPVSGAVGRMQMQRGQGLLPGGTQGCDPYQVYHSQHYPVNPSGSMPPQGGASGTTMPPQGGMTSLASTGGGGTGSTPDELSPEELQRYAPLVQHYLQAAQSGINK
jgi:hypothetical protein